MPDLYSTITEVDQETQERLADVIEMRFADPRHQEMLKAYLGELHSLPSPCSRDGLWYSRCNQVFGQLAESREDCWG